MNTKQQPEALRLEEMLTAKEWPGHVTTVSYTARECVAELRRLHAYCQELESQLAQRFDAADMATASAQGFRDGVASVSAGSEPVAKGLSDPIDALRWGANVAETLLSIGRAIGFGRAQQILGEQWEAAHDCAPRGRMGVTVGKCNPPKLWTQRSQDAYRRGWNDYAAAQPSPAAQADSVQEDAARYRFLRDGEWRGTDLEPFIRLQLNTLWDAKIDAARKQGEKQ